MAKMGINRHKPLGINKAETSIFKGMMAPPKGCAPPNGKKLLVLFLFSHFLAKLKALAQALQILERALKPFLLRVLSNRSCGALSDPYFEDAETFCSARRCQVTLSLRTSKQPKSGMITGFPVSCNCEVDCGKGALCLLKAKLMTTGRKRR
jgi:hypothetical protein